MTRWAGALSLSWPVVSWGFDLAPECHSSYPSFEKRWQLPVMNYSRLRRRRRRVCYIFVAHLAPDGQSPNRNHLFVFFGWPPVVFFFFIPNPTTRDDVEQSLTGATPDPKKIYRHRSGSIDSLLCDRINGAGAAPFPPLIDSVKRTLRSKKEEEKGKAGRDKKQEGKACSAAAAENNRNELLAAEYFSL